MPHLVGALGQRQSRAISRRPERIEQAKVDLLRMGGEDGEIDAEAVPGGAERIGRPGSAGRSG